MDIKQAIKAPGAVLLAISKGLTFAIPATIIVAPAIGEAALPIAPPRAAKEPILMVFTPNSFACIVTALLNTMAEASPEPVTVPKIKGP